MNILEVNAESYNRAQLAIFYRHGNYSEVLMDPIHMSLLIAIMRLFTCNIVVDVFGFMFSNSLGRVWSKSSEVQCK